MSTIKKWIVRKVAAIGKAVADNQGTHFIRMTKGKMLRPVSSERRANNRGLRKIQMVHHLCQPTCKRIGVRVGRVGYGYQPPLLSEREHRFHEHRSVANGAREQNDGRAL